MVRPFATLMVSAAALLAQNSTTAGGGDSLAPLRHAAQKKAADWETLARGMEARLARMLPCDPHVRAAIEEVSRASAARLSAMSQYLSAAAAEARSDTDAARAVLASEDERNKDLETERAEAAQEEMAVESQLADLANSAKRLAALNPALQKLTEIAAMVRQRAQSDQKLAGGGPSLAAPLKNLLEAFQARQAALENEQVALAVETTRWSEYYAARLARAQTECSILNTTGGRRK